jgi:HPt (histidine-containing phosphotransfer) domain-containing protein
MSEIDPAALEQLRGLTTETGGDLIVELIDVFADSATQLLADLTRALDSGEAAHATRFAHTLKGAASTVGAAQVTEGARAIEMLAHEGRIAEAATRVPALASLIAPTVAALRAAHPRNADTTDSARTSE